MNEAKKQKMKANAEFGRIKIAYVREYRRKTLEMNYRILHMRNAMQMLIEELLGFEEVKQIKKRKRSSHGVRMSCMSK